MSALRWNALRTAMLALAVLVMPASLSEGGTEEIESLAGNWSLSGGTVTFIQGDDTFIRDSDWAASPGRLEAEEDFGGILVRAVLERI